MYYVAWVTTGDEDWFLERVRQLMNRRELPALDTDKEITSSEGTVLWCPRRVTVRICRGERREVERPLFPGYVFVKTEDPASLDQELQQAGIEERDEEGVVKRRFIGLLQAGRIGSAGRSVDSMNYVPISATEEQIMRSLCGRDGRLGVSTAVVRDGELKILDGPLKGYEKYVVRVDRHKHKVVLEMLLFGQKRSFTAAIDVIEGTLPSVHASSDSLL